MEQINTILENYRPEVSQLLRRYRVIGPPNLETVKKAHDIHGDAFLTKLMAIVTPESNFTNLGDMLNPGSFLNTGIQQMQAPPPAQPKNKFWLFWDNLLTRVQATGQTIGEFKTDATGQPAAAAYQAQIAQQNLNKQLLFVGAVIIVILVVLLIFRKK